MCAIIANMKTEIFDALFTIVNFFNDPRHDAKLLKKAGISNDQNLLPVVVRVGKSGTISVGELAAQLGKNHSSTSRQVDKFVEKGLLLSYPSKEDKRVRIVTLTEDGKKLYTQLTNARSEVMEELLTHFTYAEVKEIIVSLQKLAKILAEKNK